MFVCAWSVEARQQASAQPTASLPMFFIIFYLLACFVLTISFATVVSALMEFLSGVNRKEYIVFYAV